MIDSEIEDLQRLNTGEQGHTLFDTFSGVSDNACVENYEIVRRVADAKGDSDVMAAEKNLKSLLSARAKIMAAKAAIQQSVIDKVEGVDCGASQEEQREFQDTAERFGLASESEDVGEDVYHTQVEDIKKGDMSRLMSDIDACASS